MLANQMETVNRLVLEPSFEAILDAGEFLKYSSHLDE